MAEERPATPVRLRFDRVAKRLIDEVRDAVGDTVPDGKSVIFTVTAPIRLPSKTARAVEERIRYALTRPSARVELEDVIHGNRVRIWVVARKSRRSKIAGLVHNPGVSADDLFAAAQLMV
jgi:hypothetical protein